MTETARESVGVATLLPDTDQLSVMGNIANVSFDQLWTFALEGEVKVGDILINDSHFTCRPAGSRNIVKEDAKGLYFDCVTEEGEPTHHYLDGQIDVDATGAEIYAGLAKEESFSPTTSNSIGSTD